MKTSRSPLVEEAIEKTKRSARLYLRSVAKLAKAAPAFLPRLEQATDDELEPYDALCSRFERAVEMVTGKLAKSLAIQEAGEPLETVRDRLNLMEKIGFIDSAEIWMKMRELRNRVAHEYSAASLEAILRAILFTYREPIEKVSKKL